MKQIILLAVIISLITSCSRQGLPGESACNPKRAAHFARMNSGSRVSW